MMQSRSLAAARSFCRPTRRIALSLVLAAAGLAQLGAGQAARAADATTPPAKAGELHGLRWSEDQGAPVLFLAGPFGRDPSIFKLDDPARVVLDFANTKLAAGLVGTDGVVAVDPELRALGVTDMVMGEYEVRGLPLVRAVLTLDREVDPSVLVENGIAALRLVPHRGESEDASRESARPTEKAVAVAPPVPAAVQPAATPAAAPETVAAPADAVATLRSVEMGGSVDAPEVVLVFDRPVPTSSVERLALVNPDRLVFDVRGARPAMRTLAGKLSRGAVLAVRLGLHEDKVRLVADVAAGTPLAAEPTSDGNRVRFAIGRGSVMQPFNAESVAVAPAPVAKAAAAPVVAAAPAVVEAAAEAVKSDEPMTLEAVNFTNEADRTVLRMRFSGALPQVSPTQHEQLYTLALANVRVPKHLEQVMDTRDFQSAVDVISVFNAEEPESGARIVVGVNRVVEQSVRSEGSELAWSFARPEKMSAPAFTGTIGVDEGGVTTIDYRPADANPAQVVTGPGTAVVGAAGGPIEIDDETYRRKVEEQEERLRRGEKRYTGQKMSLDLRVVDVHDVLRIIADVANINIVADDNVRGRVTVRLIEVPWDLALDIVLRAKGLGYEKAAGGRVIRVAIQGTLDREEDRRFEVEMIKLYSAALKVYIIPVNYSTAAKLVRKVKSILSPRGEVDFDDRTNMLIVKDIEDFARKAKALVEQLDLQTPQVVIEVRIVEANIVNTRGLGIQWGFDVAASSATGNPTGLSFPGTVAIGGAPDSVTSGQPGVRNFSPLWVVNAPVPGSNSGLGLRLGNVGNTANIDLRLSAAEAEGEIKIVSSPRITTMDNTQALISQGQVFPIIEEFQTVENGLNRVSTRVTKIKTGILLTVTPHITLDQSVILKVSISKTDPDFSNQIRGVPSLLEKLAKTEILVQSGDTAVIGGIYSNRTNVSKSGVPGLMSVPVLGWLFRFDSFQESKTELLIFITPHIVVSDREKDI